MKRNKTVRYVEKPAKLNEFEIEIEESYVHYTGAVAAAAIAPVYKMTKNPRTEQTKHKQIQPKSTKKKKKKKRIDAINSYAEDPPKLAGPGQHLIHPQSKFLNQAIITGSWRQAWQRIKSN